MSKQAISARQLAWLIATFIYTAFANMGWQLTRAANQDAIFSYGLPILYAFLIALLFYQLSQKFPGKNLFQINRIIAGKWIGTIINLVVMLQIWFVFARDVANSTIFISNCLLRFTKPEMIILLFIIVMIYYGKTSIEVTARVNEIFFMAFAIVFVTFPILLSNEISISQWDPVLTGTLPQFALTNLYGLVHFSDLFVLGAFLHLLHNAKRVRSAFRHGLLLGAVGLTWNISLAIAVFGSKIVSSLRYTGLSLSTQMHISDFLDRMEIFLYIFFLPMLIINSVVSFLAFQTGVNSFAKGSDPSVLSKSLGWMLMLTMVVSFENVSQISNFVMFAYPVFIVFVQPLLIVLLFLLAARFRTAETQGPETQEAAAAKRVRPVSYWMRLTHIMILLVGLFMSLGMWLARDMPWVGNICMLGFGVCLLLAAFTTYKEMKSADALYSGS